MGQLSQPWPDFAGLFAEPGVQRMLDELNDHEFEHFVQYVFEQAGYFVEDSAWQHGNGLDLKLFVGGGNQAAFHAGVQVKHWVSTHRVGAPEVVSLRGGLPHADGVTGYFVTTSAFNESALAEAKNQVRIWPIDADHFLRYIDYVRGSRPGSDQMGATYGALPPGTSPAPISPRALFEADEIERRSPDKTRVLTLANHKGGVGKTTTALNLAFGLAGKDYKQRVLLVDMDAQANLTRELSSPHQHNAVPMHLGDYFAGRRTLAELIRPTNFPGLWLIPSHNDLALSDWGLAAGPEAELRFARELHAANIAPPQFMESQPFDWIIIDTGPSMGLFARSAIAASHYVLMPLSPGVFADVGVHLLRRTIATMTALTGAPITLLGGVVTQWKDDQFNRDLLGPVATKLPLIGENIPFDRANIEKAHMETGEGRPRNIFNRRCAASRAYTTLVGEVVSRVQ